MSGAAVAVIPARLGSTRFAGKILYRVKGKPLLFHVWNQVRKAKSLARVVIATDHPKIARAAEAFGAEVVMTARRHATGSDRVAQAALKLTGGIILNIQGDTLGLSPVVLDRAIGRMKARPGTRFATLARRICDDRELFDPDVVKVVTATDGRALWFSRFPVPYMHHASAGVRAKQFGFLAHIGVYLFRRKALEAFAGWKRGPLEKAESLEQLRILENGGRIEVFRTSSRVFDINSPDDLRKIRWA